ncbi:hypothetical protein D9M71_160350 [compost metagenome]
MGAGEVHQGAEEWRQDAVHVATGRRFDAPGNELGAVFGLPDEAVDILDKGQWHLALMGPAHAEHDRQVGGTPADLLDQLHGLVRVVFAQAPTDDHATVSRVGTDRDFGLVQRADQLHFDFVIP